MTAKATALLDQIQGGVAFDVVQDLSIPFPLLVICELLGRGRVAVAPLLRLVRGRDPRRGRSRPRSSGRRYQVEMWEYLIGVAEERRRAPADDLVSVLANVGSDPESGGEELSEAELAMFLIQLLVAGNETTRNLISGGLVALAENPDQWAALRADRSLIPAAVEELLRWTTPVISFMRTATADTTIRGVAVAAGDPVLLVYASANRDEEVFGPDAGELRIDRHPNPHVSFGFGPALLPRCGAGPARGPGRAGRAARPLRIGVAGRPGRADAEPGHRRRAAAPRSSSPDRRRPPGSTVSRASTAARRHAAPHGDPGADVGDVLGIAVRIGTARVTADRSCAAAAPRARRARAAA